MNTAKTIYAAGIFDREGPDDLLKIIGNKDEYAFLENQGLYTFPNDPTMQLHQACLDLEKQGLIYRHQEGAEFVHWMVKE